MTTPHPTKASALDARANRFHDDQLALSPIAQTFAGIHDNDDTWDDFSPAQLDRIADLIHDTLRDIDAIEKAEGGFTGADAVTAAAMRDRLGLSLEFYDATEWHAELNNITSPFQSLRDTFALMPTDTAAERERLRARIGALPRALEQMRERLSAGRERGLVAAQRQVEVVAAQADEFAKPGGYLDELTAHGNGEEAWSDAAAQARRGLSEFSAWLRGDLAPSAPTADAVGRERYERFSHEFVGARVDLVESYEWALNQLAGLITEQQKLAADLYGAGTSVAEAYERLNADPARQLHGADELQRWMQGWADRALDEVGRDLVDIDPRMGTIDCVIDPAGTGGIYYLAPAEDFSRPGRMCWAVPEGEDVFHTWQELTTVFHEGVPGHHLQIGQAMCAGLNAWRAQDCWLSGHGEGWALYAESLMTELGYETEAGERMGYLDSQRLRLARVALDIGVHLGLEVPGAGPWGDLPVGQRWDRAYAWEWLRANVAMAERFLRFELDRYLGWPGQAPSYALGQRFWRQLRGDYLRAAGACADLPVREADGRVHPLHRRFHTEALRLGSLPLDVMRSALLGTL
ncbi:DUF885 domain-containing protein [Nanchangia anserum]|uniref:DUF885 domain-containing protein n=1 Tax=Nanchangia anserum TaxID=2692125 RepID=A0A8I0KNF4_9ACTO|nr:DUF885 domain-containing protein [Nanchangia anserum]MBD3689226.1 DUF885 domain-containing protein [Nanchangia anserum]QOX81449.1 DUF885 domain-containing protein [Nanchangia anserum]